MEMDETPRDGSQSNLVAVRSTSLQGDFNHIHTLTWRDTWRKPTGGGVHEQELQSFIKDIGKHGFVWQFITLAGFHCNALITDTFAHDFKESGMLAYMKNVQRRERTHGVETLTHQKWSGAPLIDAQIKTVQGGASSTLAMGYCADPSTEITTFCPTCATPERVSPCNSTNC
jgi:isocitrate lyase